MLDLRLIGATIRTMDPRHPVAHQVGIWRGRVVAVDAAATALPAAQVVDLQGATVVPGLVDAHVHLAWAGLRAHSTSVAPCRDVGDVLAAIGAAARERPPGSWVDIVGYDQRPLGRHLTATELDTVAAGRKLFVIHDSGHACAVNSAVLGELPTGTAHDNGVLAEAGMVAVRALRQPYPVDELIEAIIVASDTCLAEGVTSVVEAGIGGGLISHSPVELAAYQRAIEQGRLPVRVQAMITADLLRPLGAHADDGIARGMDLGLRTGLGGSGSRSERSRFLPTVA